MAIRTLKRTILILPLAAIVGCHSAGSDHQPAGYATYNDSAAVDAGHLGDAAPPAPPYVEESWPGSSGDVVFSWADGAPVNVKKSGKAHVNAAGIMDLTSGAITPLDFNDKLLAACKKSNQLSIEVVLMTSNLKQKGPARIVSFSKDTNLRNFTLGQEDNSLVLRLRTSGNDTNGTKIVVDLVDVEKERPMHLIVTYQDGKTVCYVDGKQVSTSDVPKGSFGNWEPMQLIFGDEITGQRNWDGTIERVAMGSSFIDAKTAQRRFDLMLQDMTE
jgi:hypothetical protein